MLLRIGSRGSDLALAQSRFIQSLLGELPARPETEIQIIKTSGDLIQNVPLSELAGTPEERKGFFTKEIEDALLRNEVDLAVHSYKDLPTLMPPGLIIAAMPRRVADHDLLVFAPEKRARDEAPYLAPGARVGTSAVRRITQMTYRFPDLVCHSIRGNVPTRLRKLKNGDFDAIILAAAGIERLRAAGTFDSGENAGLLDGLEFLPLQPPEFIPAPAQGALAIQCREGDEPVIAILRQLHDEAMGRGVDAERAVLAALEGGCHLPLGASCRRESENNGGGEVFGMHVFLGAEAEDNRRGRSFDFKRSGDDPDLLARRVIRELREALPIVLTGRPDRMQEIAGELAAEPGAAERLIQLPLIEVEALPITDEFRAAFGDWTKALNDAGENDAAADAPSMPARPLIAVFSAPGADTFAAFLKAENLSLPAEVYWAVNGERTAAKVRELFPGANVAFESPDGTGEALARRLLESGQTSALAVSAERSRPEFTDVMSRAGGRVNRLLLYRTSSRPPAPDRLRDLPGDALIVFGSPSSVETFFPALAAAGLDEQGLRYCALGPTTAKAIHAAGRIPYALAARTDYTDFVRELL